MIRIRPMAVAVGALFGLGSWAPALAGGGRPGPDEARSAPAAVPPAKAADPGPKGPGAAPDADRRGGWLDSFRYYGPNGLWRAWTEGQRRGRDTWIMWTGGNQKFLRLGTERAGQLPVPISIEYFRLLDSRRRNDRFRLFGLINEPNCEQANEPDEYGLYLDRWKGDPYRRTAGEDRYSDAHFTQGEYPYYPDPKVEQYARYYGAPTGIVGMRKFKNPKFDKSKWNVAEYFKAPGKIQPPYLIGFSCAFCHISFDPTNPPRDPAHPRWENLAANMGNQYLREGDLFFARGRIIFGDRMPPGAKPPANPYDTTGLGPESLLYHYAVTQQPGTSETSRISYDFINNPNTINSIFYLGNRPLFPERSPDGKLRLVNHVLKDGADSVGIQMALLRVWINIGCEGRYWLDSLYNPVTGRRQRPLDIEELALHVDEQRKQELRAQYGPDVGQDWAEAHRRNPELLAYLASYTPYHLADALARDAGNPELKDLRPDPAKVERGKQLFARHCAECHSNKQPGYTMDDPPERRQEFFRESVQAPDFLANNTLSDDRRYSVLQLGTNMARALATNAVEGDIWAELSSRDYKALPPIGRVTFRYTVRPVQGKPQLVPKDPREAPDPQNDLTISFTPPGGGRGYYRTPSLVSMWATAPYLHNNGLGDYVVIREGRRQWAANDGHVIEDPIDTSVKGRMMMFQDGVEKLLWPEKRRAYIKRTLSDCYLIDLKPLVRHLLPGVVTWLLFEYAEEQTARSVDAYIAEKRLPAAEAAALRARILAEARAQLARVRDTIQPGDVAALTDRLVALARERLVQAIADAAGPAHAEAVRAKLADLHAKLAAEATALRQVVAAKVEQASILKVPRGTPVNLYFNLGPGELPYAVKAQLKYRDDPRRLAGALLLLSDCPDLVEDKGHTYGAELSDQDKRDLIEYLKTL